MDNQNIFLIKILFCTGLFYFAGILTVISYPLIARQVGMNRWYGFRFPEAFLSEESWYAINAYGGRMFTIWAAFAAVAGILLFILPTENATLLLVAYFSVLATLVIPIGITAVFASHYRRQKDG